MSQNYHQGIFSFSNGIERSPITHQRHQQHIASQIGRREKGKVQGFEPAPPSLVGVVGDEESGGVSGFETNGILSEMFHFSTTGATTAAELLDPHSMANYRSARPHQPAAGISQEWYGHRHDQFASGFGSLGESDDQNTNHLPHQISNMNADSAAAMQLFLMNPQTKSPSPSSTTHHHLQEFTGTASNTGGGAFGQFTWVPGSCQDGSSTTTPNQLNNNLVGRVKECQGLSLSLSSSLQHLKSAKAEEFRIGDNGFLYFNQGPGVVTPNLGKHHQQPLHIHSGYDYSSLSAVNFLRNSKYLKPAQQLLEEFCSVKKNKFIRKNSNPNSNSGASTTNDVVKSVPSDVAPMLASDIHEYQRRKVKLLDMLDEVDRRYNHYCHQMQMVVNSFDMVMGSGAAVPYTALAQKAMSRHFRCLKDAMTAQLKHTCEVIGDKNSTGKNSGLTKGETPRLKWMEQSLRQRRVFQQMGVMEQEAWRPQRGLPDRSVNVLRAWLFENFLHPYPSDSDKHLLARQTGLSRNQVSNWFINARVRLWKPMVEEMYQQEAKEEDSTDYDDSEKTQSLHSVLAASESDLSLIAMNRQCFSENQANSNPKCVSPTCTIMAPTTPTNVTNSEVAPPVSQCSAATTHDSELQTSKSMDADDTCRLDTIVSSTNADNGSKTNPGDVSLTLGLRHGNMPEKSTACSVRGFGTI